MAKIELYFGHPQEEENIDAIERRACNQDINIETSAWTTNKYQLIDLTPDNPTS